MGKARTDKKLRQLMRRAAVTKRKTERQVPMTWSYWRDFLHCSFRFSRGEAPIGFGIRVFAWKPESEFVFSIDVMFLAFTIQFGVHV